MLQSEAVWHSLIAVELNYAKLPGVEESAALDVRNNSQQRYFNRISMLL